MRRQTTTQQLYLLYTTIMAGLVSSPMITSEILVAGQWLIKQKIGSGSFGEIYEAHDIHTNQRVAVKIESCDSKYPQLVEEHKVYISIHSQAKLPNGSSQSSYHYSSKHSHGGRHHHTTDGGIEPPIMPGFPKIYWYSINPFLDLSTLIMLHVKTMLQLYPNRLIPLPCALSGLVVLKMVNFMLL